MPGPEGDNEVIFLRNSHLEDSLAWLIKLGRQAQGRKEEAKKGEHRGLGGQGRWGAGGIMGCKLSLRHRGWLMREPLPPYPTPWPDAAVASRTAVRKEPVEVGVECRLWGL